MKINVLNMSKAKIAHKTIPNNGASVALDISEDMLSISKTLISVELKICKISHP